MKTKLISQYIAKEVSEAVFSLQSILGNSIRTLCEPDISEDLTSDEARERAVEQLSVLMDILDDVQQELKAEQEELH